MSVHAIEVPLYLCKREAEVDRVGFLGQQQYVHIHHPSNFRVCRPGNSFSHLCLVLNLSMVMPESRKHSNARTRHTRAHTQHTQHTHAPVLTCPSLTQVAEAPKIRTNKVQGIVELDEDMQYMLPAAGDKDIDLSMLTAVLASSEQVGNHKCGALKHRAVIR
eukprot:1159272-Pelagomonas_calceolata.AAC.6